MKQMCRPYICLTRNIIIAYLFIKGLIAISLLTMRICQYEELYEELNFVGLIKISF